MTIREPTDGEIEYLRAAVKGEIRDRRRRLRSAMPREAREARSAAIAERVRELPEYGAASTILAFVSMRTEVQTAPIVEDAWRRGITVVAPRMTPTFDDLELRAWREGDALEESGMMFLQPPASAPSIDDAAVDLVLVPALAVDERGHRIGYGKGFYDRLLPRLGNATRVALIFDFERVAEVPERAGDVPVDAIVTDARVVRCPRPS